MKKLFACLVVLVSCSFSSLTNASSINATRLEISRLELSAAFTPPHNEPIIQDKIARYKLEGDFGFRYWRIDLDVNTKVWFLNDWQTPDEVGHGFPTAWENTNWNFNGSRLDFNVKLGMRVYDRLQVFVEHYQYEYLSGSKPASHASEYYWMTGLRWKIY